MLPKYKPIDFDDLRRRLQVHLDGFTAIEIAKLAHPCPDVVLERQDKEELIEMRRINYHHRRRNILERSFEGYCPKKKHCPDTTEMNFNATTVMDDTRLSEIHEEQRKRLEANQIMKN